jgi:hypothetical protein
MNHLVYCTFGEEKSSVYETQVIQLLNYIVLNYDWKVTIIQISNNSIFYNLDERVNKIHIKRKHKLPVLCDFSRYAYDMNKYLININSDTVFFNSRGYFAFAATSKYISRYKIKHVKNNLDIRGISEEAKEGYSSLPKYLYLDLFFKKTIKTATSIHCVSSSMVEYIKKKYRTTDKVIFHVIPTLSIFNCSNSQIDRRMVFIGNIAWISRIDFITMIKKIHEIIYANGYSIDAIGSKKVLELNDYVRFVGRISPKLLSEIVGKYSAGIILRDDSIVNKVSSPCKISDYLCSGLPVIYSGSIGSIEDLKHNSPELEQYLINYVDVKTNSGRIEKLFNIGIDERKFISKIAHRYFGIEEVSKKMLHILESE